MKLPTVLGKQLLIDHFKVRMEKPEDAYLAVAAFQRMAITSTLEDAVAAVKPWFKISNREIAENSPEMAAIMACYAVAKKDVLGHAIDAVMAIMDSPVGGSKDKLAAAAIVNELFGEKELIKDEVLTDKLMINLVSDKK